MKTNELQRLLFFVLTLLLGATGFNPREYDAQAGKSATCQAVKRTVSLSRTATGGISDSTGAFAVEEEESVPVQIHYLDINPAGKRTILMVHGWPSIWSTWRNQIEEFKDDYRLIMPSLRGFGKSTHPGNVRYSGTLQDSVGDMACILEHAGVREVVCMGHDWGSQVCYEMGRARPDITSAVIGITIPYVPAGDTFTPSTHMVKHFPKLNYQIYFDEKTDDAAIELGKDIRRTLRSVYRTKDSLVPDAFLRSKDSFLEAYGPEELLSPIPYLTQEEEDYLVEQFGIQGFKNTLSFYITENRYQGWKFVHEQGNRTVPQPVLTVYPTKDSVANWKLVAQVLGKAEYVPNLTSETVPAGHWIHLENPKAFNAIARRWLSKLGGTRDESVAKAADEL